MTALAVGFGLGFAVALQVGPVTLLTVRSVIRGGLRVGLPMGVGVAVIDAAYAAAGAAGRALRTALVATASNPLTILSWAAIFVAASTAELVSSAPAAALMVGGVLAGSFAWMALLAGGLALARRRIRDRGLRLLDAASGTGILVCGGLLGWRTLREG